MRKSILFIFPRKIYPIIGGDQIRAHQQIEFLTEIFDVHLVYLHTRKEEDNYALNFFPQLKSSKCFVHSRGKSILGAFKSFINLKPLQVNYYTNQKLRKYIYANQGHYDLFFSGNPRVAEHILYIKKIKYLDFVDAASMNCKNAISSAKGIKKILYILDFHLMRKYEQLMLKRFDRCSIISDVDKTFIENE